MQFWHAAILSCVVAALSIAWFTQSSRVRLNEVDAELLAAARVLDGSLRGFRIRENDQIADQQFVLSPADNRRLSLPRPEREADASSTPPYFAIWLRDGRKLISNRLPEGVGFQSETTTPGDIPNFVRRGDFRELRIVGPAGTQILVGRNIGLELAALRQLAVRIVALAVGILLVGLVGGWWLSRSVLRPIQAMSEAAARFSVTDMASRIDVSETDSELGELAQILNNAFDRVQASFDKQRQFAADASHELRTPLAVIQSQIELALRKPRSSTEYVKALNVCSEAEIRLSDLVESLLTLARLDAGSDQSECSLIRLDLLAAKCTDLMRPVADQAGVRLDTEVNMAWITGDRAQLEHAILNLIKNGIAYNRRGGIVDVTVKRLGDLVVLKVTDTGIGMSDEDLQHATERFFRADKARSREQGGSGLGLSIAAEVIESHRGSLQIASVVNEGTAVEASFRSADRA